MIITFIEKYIIHNLDALFLCLTKVSATRIGKTRLASEYILMCYESIWIFPQLIASDGDAPASLASYSTPVFINTPCFQIINSKIPKSIPFLHIFAFIIWCLTKPPPKIIAPLYLAFRAILLIWIKS